MLYFAASTAAAGAAGNTGGNNGKLWARFCFGCKVGIGPASASHTWIGTLAHVTETKRHFGTELLMLRRRIVLLRTWRLSPGLQHGFFDTTQLRTFLRRPPLPCPNILTPPLPSKYHTVTHSFCAVLQTYNKVQRTPKNPTSCLLPILATLYKGGQTGVRLGTAGGVNRKKTQPQRHETQQRHASTMPCLSALTYLTARKSEEIRNRN